jgi:hypothetical protein
VSWNELRDLGPFPGEYGILNSLSALLASDDWLDPWFSSGAELLLGRSATRSMRVIVERDRRAEPVLDAEHAADFRPLPAIDEGWRIVLEQHRDWVRGGTTLGITGREAQFDPSGPTESFPYVNTIGSLAWRRGSAGAPSRISARLDGGLAAAFQNADVPVQERFYLGGRGTVPGWDFRMESGDAFWLARAEASHDLARPWLTGRALAAAGATGRWAHRDPISGPITDHRVLTSAGAGLGLLWDVIHVDLARGLDGGKWELVVSVDRRFRGWL